MSECKTINCPTCGNTVDESFLEQKCPRCQSLIESKFLCGSCHSCGESMLTDETQLINNNFLKKIFSFFSRKQKIT